MQPIPLKYQSQHKKCHAPQFKYGKTKKKNVFVANEKKIVMQEDCHTCCLLLQESICMCKC